MGAGADIDGDGEIEIHEMEATWTGKYLLSAELRLRKAGIHVIPLCDGTYSERHKRVNRYMGNFPNAVYIAAHINAGQGSYGSAFYDHRSKQGPILAGKLCKQMKKWLTELRQDARAIACSPKDWTKNAYYTIANTKAIAICYEPCFIDTRSHRSLFSDHGMERIGWALADGIIDFFGG